MAFESSSMAYLPQEEPMERGEVCAFQKQGGERGFCLKKMLQGIYHEFQKKQLQNSYFCYNLIFPAFNPFYLTYLLLKYSKTNIIP